MQTPPTASNPGLHTQSAAELPTPFGADTAPSSSGTRETYTAEPAGHARHACTLVAPVEGRYE
jgi:hypothetical protein